MLIVYRSTLPSYWPDATVYGVYIYTRKTLDQALDLSICKHNMRIGTGLSYLINHELTTSIDCGVETPDTNEASTSQSVVRAESKQKQVVRSLGTT